MAVGATPGGKLVSWLQVDGLQLVLCMIRSFLAPPTRPFSQGVEQLLLDSTLCRQCHEHLHRVWVPTHHLSLSHQNGDKAPRTMPNDS